MTFVSHVPLSDRVRVLRLPAILPDEVVNRRNRRAIVRTRHKTPDDVRRRSGHRPKRPSNFPGRLFLIVVAWVANLCCLAFLNHGILLVVDATCVAVCRGRSFVAGMPG
jgi:hypothetical protein